MENDANANKLGQVQFWIADPFWQGLGPDPTLYHREQELPPTEFGKVEIRIRPITESRPGSNTSDLDPIFEILQNNQVLEYKTLIFFLYK